MSKRDDRWWELAHQLAQIADQLGRLPQPSDEHVPPSLLMWVRNQRRALGLTGEQQHALERVEGWSWAPREDHWEDRLAEVARFFATKERAPRVRAAEEPEASLGLWLARQRRAAVTQAMPYARLCLWNECSRELEQERP